MTDNPDKNRTTNRAYDGDETPMRPGEPSIGQTERAMRETSALAAQTPDGRTVSDAEHPIEERRERQIEDNVRHTDSIGRR